MSFLRGLAQWAAGNTMIYPTDSVLNLLLTPISPRHLWLLTPGVWIMIVLALLVSAMLRYTRFGRHTFAIGSNEQTARLCGVPVDRTKVMIYALGAALTAVAGVLQFSYLGMGDPTTAAGMELDIIAAVVIGGASLSGGQGTVLGSIVGALIMAVVSNGCNKLGLQNNVQLMVTGSIIILAVMLDRLRHRKTG
jgi:ribose/xylose/arabinose/galactoside ABC-type transport system permease subunit